MRKSTETYLNQVFALSLGDKRLQFRGRKGVNETSLRHDKQEDLCASEDRELVSLQRDEAVSIGWLVD